ncbi:P22AR C-terminal domain-containing protein [Morganella morganii]|uniref:P22AR C-terminal domain-containing protein n=1 Tax=Morganella morganii TaxID=582 RepID=UPI003F6907C1
MIRYQEECDDVLYEYWTTGEVKKKQNFRQSTAKELIPLRQTAERLIAHGVGNIYPDIWKHVHAEFGVQHINELLPEQIPLAISYLDALEGEYIPKQEALPEPVGITFTEDETLALVTMCNAANFAQQEAKAMYPAFVEFGSRFTGSIYDIAHSNGIFVRNGTKVMMDKLSGLRLSGKAWVGALNRLTMNA